jgi:putative redox protein
MPVTIDVEYQGGLHTQATHGPSQASLTTDAPTDNGGKGAAFSPTDLVATALGSCILTIMGLVAERNELDLSGMRARVTKEMVADPHRRIARLEVVLTWPAGRDLAEADRTKLTRAASHCPVHASLHPDTQVDLVWEEA